MIRFGPEISSIREGTISTEAVTLNSLRPSHGVKYDLIAVPCRTVPYALRIRLNSNEGPYLEVGVPTAATGWYSVGSSRAQ